MFLSNPAIRLVLFAAIMPTLTGCWRPDAAPESPVPAVKAPKGKFPFKTREPENFQCDIIETAGTVTRRKRLAMKGPWARLDLDLGTADHRAILVTDKEYLIDFDRGIYAERSQPTGQPGAFSELTRELLLASPHTEFEEIGREGSIIRFRATTDRSEQSEAVIHYDETIGLPVKQEFFSIVNGNKSLQFTIEIVNFTSGSNSEAFSIPSGLRKVPFDEIGNGQKR